MNSMWDGFSQILNPLDVSESLPFEIIPEHWFKKASPQETDLIKQAISSHKDSSLLYEFGPTDSSIPTATMLLPPEEWRYYVISFRGSNDKLKNIGYAANLLKDDITLGYTFMSNASGLGRAMTFSLAPISNFYVEHFMSRKQPKSFGRSEANQISAYYDLIKCLDGDHYPNIARALSEFDQTKIIPQWSRLKILSYFSIIECILTHQPKPSDTMDSLTRQITYKMLLLGKRFDRELLYARNFPTISQPNKAWNILYEYRSVIAHGGEPDFRGRFGPLVSRDNIHSFLTEALKLLLIFGLKDPEFLFDFQNC